MSLRMMTDGGYDTPSPLRNVNAPLSDGGCAAPPLARGADAPLNDALANLRDKSQFKPDVTGDLGIDHVSEADAGVRGATSGLVDAVERRVLDAYTYVTGKVVTPDNIDQAVNDSAHFATAKGDVLNDYKGDDAKDVAAAINTLQIKAAVDQAEAAAPSRNAAAVAGLTQVVKSLQGEDSRSLAIEALSVPVQQVMDQVGKLSPYQPHDPATPIQRSQAEHGLLALAKELAPADDAAQNDTPRRMSTQAALNGVENTLIGIDRTIEPNSDNSSIVEHFWQQHEQQAAVGDAGALF